MGEELEANIASNPITLNREFLERPDEIPIVELFQRKLQIWLDACELRNQKPSTITGRLPSYFVYALHREFRDSTVDYAPLLQFLTAEVSEAWHRERTWEAYRARLSRELDEPLFGEEFSLRQIFIWPRAYFVRQRLVNEEREPSHRENKTDHIFDEDNREVRVVIDLTSSLDKWLDSANQNEREKRDDVIRVISGDPGAGKSSFVRMYAAHRMLLGDNVLIIPLHRFNVLGDLAESVEAYCQLIDDCPTGLLKAGTAAKTLLLVLDGLDELAQQGVIGARIAIAFVDDVIRTLHLRNMSHLRLRVIISGRPISVQNVADRFRREGQLIYLLPYFVANTYAYSGLQNYHYSYTLPYADFRNDWWRKYGELKGYPYEGIPKDLCSKNLDDITAQPLLNYLIALVYKRGNVDFTREVTRNEIYKDLLDRVFDRDWDSTHGHRTLEGIDRSDFHDLLEEMALTAWHGRERITSVSAVEAACSGTYLERVLREYKKRCEEGVGQLFTAFYFRKSEHIVGTEPTFEFTHKSFGEYLVGIRLIDAIRDLHDQFIEADELRRRRSDSWTEAKAVQAWFRLFGTAPISQDIMPYMYNEVRYRAETLGVDVKQWQETIARLIEEVLRNGVRWEQFGSDDSVKVFMQRCRNAEGNCSRACKQYHLIYA